MNIFKYIFGYKSKMTLFNWTCHHCKEKFSGPLFLCPYCYRNREKKETRRKDNET